MQTSLIPPTTTPQLAQGERLQASNSSSPMLSPGKQVENAEQTREAFAKFVGTTVFGQMLSSMRKTVGEPAYFHGGQAEKVFQGQLDQAIADEITTGNGATLANDLFEHQFPQMAEILRRAESSDAGPLDQLANLPRR